MIVEKDKWTVELIEDGEDLILPLPQEVLDQLDAQEGDVLQFLDNGDGSWTLIKMKYDSDSGVEGQL